jgi:hypothetical protein
MKIKALIQILLPVLLAGCLVGCENMDWYCIWGNGILEEETRELAEYDGVVAEGDFEVIYIPDTAFFMVVETDENLIPYIEDEILDNTLYIDYGTRKCLRPENPMRLYVYAPEVYLLSLVGSGKILAESIYTDELSLQIEGSGVIDITHVDVLDLQVFITGSGEADLRGTTETAQYHIIGSGTIDARHVTAEECLADISGSGTIYCHASEMLEAIISGSGNIYYRGYPEVHQDISGTGSVRRID